MEIEIAEEDGWDTGGGGPVDGGIESGNEKLGGGEELVEALLDDFDGVFIFKVSVACGVHFGVKRDEHLGPERGKLSQEVIDFVPVLFEGVCAVFGELRKGEGDPIFGWVEVVLFSVISSSGFALDVSVVESVEGELAGDFDFVGVDVFPDEVLFGVVAHDPDLVGKAVAVDPWIGGEHVHA